MIAIACDHGGFDLKQQIMSHLKDEGVEYRDFGCYDHTSCDYPDYARPAAQAVADGECDARRRVGVVLGLDGVGRGGTCGEWGDERGEHTGDLRRSNSDEH